MNTNKLVLGLFPGLFLGLFLGFGVIFSSTEPAYAAADGKCFSQIQLPQDKEELDLGDVEHAVNAHLLRLGVTGQTVKAHRLDDDIIVAEIRHRGNLLRQLKIDASNATIIERRNYGRPVGFEAPNYRRSLVRPDLFMSKVRYSRQLRRHMLGDGQEWAGWIGEQAGIPCLDDYRFGGPAIEEPGNLG